MTVRDVQRGDRGEGRNQLRRVRRVGAPDGVAHAVHGFEVEERCFAFATEAATSSTSGVARYVRNTGPVWAQSSIMCLRAVVLLVHARVLVLLDHAGVVVVQAEAARDARLHVPAHRQSIDVEADVVLRHEWRRLAQRVEVLVGRAGRRVVVRCHRGRQVDLGPRHVEKAQRIGGQRPGFLRRDDVVGHRRHAGGGTQASGAARETEQERPSGWRNYRLGGEGGSHRSIHNSQFTIHKEDRNCSARSAIQFRSCL